MNREVYTFENDSNEDLNIGIGIEKLNIRITQNRRYL